MTAWITSWSDGLNIAMWSGPRNLSTAMMRSFGSRADCQVRDEPYYAAYLAVSGLDHPLREAVIQAGLSDPAEVSALCRKPSNGLVYQKQMTHHMLPGFDRQWIGEVVNVFLIRDPFRVVASYHAKREHPRLADLGFEEQAALFELAGELTGTLPVVIDAAAILADPPGMLQRLCAAIGIAFDPAMLAWKAGPHPDDGVWAPHWYKAVWSSTGFAPPEGGGRPELPPGLDDVARAAMPYYERLAAQAL